MDPQSNHKTRWQDIELEGRLISSCVAVVVVALAQNEVSTAVQVLAVANVLDLFRCFQRQHEISSMIWLHHAIVIVFAIQYNVYYDASYEQPAQRLLLMEMTNPFLHCLWILSKHPLYVHSFKSFQKLSAIALLVMWPQYRFQNLLLIAMFVYNLNVYLFGGLFALLCLQVQWYSLLLSNIIAKWGFL